MKRTAIVLLVLLASVLVTLALYEDNGYVLLSWGVWSIESSLVLVILLLLLALVITVAVWRLVTGVWRWPVQLVEKYRRSRAGRDRDVLAEAFLHCSRGEWSRGGKLLAARGEKSGHPLAALLLAACSADREGQVERRERALAQADACATDDDARTAVGLTRARLELGARRHEQALAALNGLPGKAANNTLALDLRREACVALGRWQELRELLPLLRRRRAQRPEALAELTVTVYTRLMREALQQAEAPRLLALYQEVPRALRSHPEIVGCYAQCLAASGNEGEAAAVLQRTLRRDWHEALALQFGTLSTDDPGGQLSAAQGWLRRHGELPSALFVVGRLCARQRLWGKARHYLEAAVRAEPRAAFYEELGRLLRDMGEHTAANEAFAAGLARALRHDQGIGQRPEPLIDS